MSTVSGTFGPLARPCAGRLRRLAPPNGDNNRIGQSGRSGKQVSQSGGFRGNSPQSIQQSTRLVAEELFRRQLDDTAEARDKMAGSNPETINGEIGKTRIAACIGVAREKAT